MRKQTKLAVVLSAAALLAVGASMTSFAAKGWVNEGDAWYYYDNSGDYVTDKWKSYNGNYFYLGDEGYMLTNELIEDGNNFYYVDANGAMVKNTWVAVPADEDEEQDVEYRWYYFGSNGKAYKDADKKTINGKKYGFDDEGKMLFGFVRDRQVINDEDDAVLNCDHYYGTNDDGAMHTGWLLYQDALDAAGYDDEFYWFWFDSKGVKKIDATKKINGKTYSFDGFGVMDYEWANATIGKVSTTGWFNAAEDGHLAKSEWIWATNDDVDPDSDHWWYADKHGYLVKNTTKKINSKWYAFDADGKMCWGFVWLNTDSVKTASAVLDEADPEDITSDQIYAHADTMFYFSSDEEKDGSMKTGASIKIELYDDTFTFGFDKKTGAALDGIEKNKLYKNGILQTATENKYDVAEYDGNLYLVSSNGTRMKATKRTYKDDNDNYYFVEDGKDSEGYTIWVADSAKAAKGEKDDSVKARELVAGPTI